MAYSPTPQSGGLSGAGHAGGSNPFYRLDRRSPSPPSQQPIVNKRDKRRLVLQERLAEISMNFAEHRDANYRKQLQQYQADINFVNGAQLYDNKPLLEPGEDDDEELGVNGVAGGRQQQLGLVNGHARNETQPKIGRHAARFIQEVNNAMEQRDVDLTANAYNFNFAIQQYEKDYKFAVEVAEREHLRLLKSLRQQLISTVQQKKTTLHREKEKLDIADTNALLHYPNQFSINSTASPGGPQSNRKTRHTRHRLDADDLDSAINNSTNNGKRKRKIAGDAESGSPGPAQNRDLTELPSANGYKDSQFRLEIQAAPPPVYALSRLFNDRELNANLQEATYEVIRSYNDAPASSNKRRRANLAVPTDLLVPATADPADLDDDASVANPEMTDGALEAAGPSLVATAMDRTPSQLYHATRSAGRLQAATDPKTALGELAGRQSAADLIGSYNRGNEKPKKADGDDYQRAPPLSDQEAQDDVKLMEAAIRRMDAAMNRDDDEDEDMEEEGREDDSIDRKLLDLAAGEEKEDYLGPPGFGKATHGMEEG